MNPYKHAELSVKRRGGNISDYYPIHSFMDTTKELCSDNRHRILHNHWGIRRVIIPIFGPKIQLENKTINIKDMLEEDHLLPDFRNKFIPTLADFVEAIDDDPKLNHQIDQCFKLYQDQTDIAELLLSPLHITGKTKSLLLTHNSWFIQSILPKIFKHIKHSLIEHSIPSNEIFKRMKFRNWMDNGATYPPSADRVPKNIEL